MYPTPRIHTFFIFRGDKKCYLSPPLTPPLANCDKMLLQAHRWLFSGGYFHTVDPLYDLVAREPEAVDKLYEWDLPVEYEVSYSGKPNS